MRALATQGPDVDERAARISDLPLLDIQERTSAADRGDRSTASPRLRKPDAVHARIGRPRIERELDSPRAALAVVPRLVPNAV